MHKGHKADAQKADSTAQGSNGHVTALAQVSSQSGRLSIKLEIAQQLASAVSEIGKVATPATPPKSRAVRLSESAKTLEEVTWAYD